MSAFIGINKTTFSDPVNRRLVGGLLLSILVHALVLSMQLGIPGLGLPSLELPWKERRANVQAITIRIANAAPATLPAMPPPAIAPLTPPIVIPAPIKVSPAHVANTGIRILDAVVVSKPIPPQKKIISSKQKRIAVPAPPTYRLARPAVALPDTPTRSIAQDQLRDDNFVVPVPDPEQPIRKSNANQSTKENAKQTAAETFDKTELSEEELAKSVELEIAKEIEKEKENAEKEKAEILLKQARKLAEQLAQKQAEQKKRELDAALAARVIEQQILAKKLDEERQKQQAEKQIEDAAKQQEIAFALQKKSEAEEQVKRLQKQEALRLEMQRKEQQIVQDVEARKKIEAQEKQQTAIQQKQLEEQALKQKSEQLAARLKAEELAVNKAAEHKLAAQKLVEQKHKN